MRIENRTLLGALFFVGAAQFILVIVIAEARYPWGYSVATNAVSNLGVGQTALLYSAWIAVCGALAFIVSLLGRRTLGTGLAATLAVAGACAVGVGLFPVRTSAPHEIFAIAAYVFVAVSVIISYRVLRPPLSHFSAGLGIIALVALVLLVTGHWLAIGKGGMERMIAYPILLWALGFGGALIGAK
ncbi:MAG: DUF998 domain-containing protein [Halobacteriota archaeon]